MIRIIPKNTKVKVQFYRGIGIYDVILGIIALGFLALTITSNLPNKYTWSLIILIIVAPMYIPLGDVKLYQALGYAFKFGVARKTFSKTKNGSSHISAIIPYSKIKDDMIIGKDNIYTGVIEVTPIEFNPFLYSYQILSHQNPYRMNTLRKWPIPYYLISLLPNLYF